MRLNRSLGLCLALGIAVGLSTSGCAKKEEAKAPEAAASDSGKIPVTTSSEEARAEFLQGRDMSERLLFVGSIPHFQKAVSLDPSFALAELSLANTAPTGTEFFDHLNKAVILAGKVSNGERVVILATEAGANNNAVKQKDYLEQLVAAHPSDERAHFNLGGYYFGQQEFPQAIEHYKKATELAPNYSPAYNILGYAYRQNGDFENAERAFRKYIELIPKDPNPYDSYAELLLKMGKFDESVAQYRTALTIDPNFIGSHVGIAADLMYSGKPGDAAAELQNITTKARNDGERRIGMFSMMVLHVDGGKMDKALAEVDKQYALGEKTKDVAAMAGDLQLKGNILREMGKPDKAKEQFERGLKMLQDSSLSQEIKDNAKLVHHFDLAGVALGKKDYAAAKTETEAFRQGAEASKNPALVKQAHELAGRIALEERDFDKAVAELLQTNQQNPYNLYRLCRAYQGKGDQAKAQEFCTKAADFNSLPQLNYAFIRTKAKAGSNR